MRHALAILFFVLGLSCVGLAGDKVISRQTKVEAGSATLTNALQVAGTTAGVPALELWRVEFAIPTSTFTNTFTIQRARTYELPFIHTSSVKTSTVGSATVIVTNYHKYSGGSATYTNSYTVGVTTNNTDTQWYDRDDFGDGLIIEPDDVVVYSFTETNDFYMTHAYKVRDR